MTTKNELQLTDKRQLTTEAALSTWDILRHQAKVLVESQFLPKAVDTWQKAAALMMYGKELGMGPMESIQSIDVIQGKPTQKPQSMKAMVHKKLPGSIFRPVKSTDDEAVFEAARPGDPPARFSFTLKDAERLGLTAKDNWKKQPKVMLSWRCIGHVARTVFSDCLSGVSYTPEELGADVDDDHNIIDTTAEKSEEKARAGATISETPTLTDKEPLDSGIFPETTYDGKSPAHKQMVMDALHAANITDKKKMKEFHDLALNAKLPLGSLPIAISEFCANNL